MADREQQGEKQGFCNRFCHLGYLKTLQGIDKLIEFTVVLLGLIFMGSVSAINADAIKFFIFVHSTAVIFITIHIVLNILGIFHRLPLVVISNFTYMILCSNSALVFLISSAITLEKYKDWRVKTGSVLGLIAMALFIIEAVYHFIQHRRGGTAQQATNGQSGTDKASTEQPPSY